MYAKHLVFVVPWFLALPSLHPSTLLESVLILIQSGFRYIVNGPLILSKSMTFKVNTTIMLLWGLLRGIHAPAEITVTAAEKDIL